MPRTREQLEQAAAEAEAWLDELEQADPAVVMAGMEDLSDLRAIAEAVLAVAGAQAELEEAVCRARANGRSWGRIAIPLGTSRQAARERYEEDDKDRRSVRKSIAADGSKRVPWAKAKAELGLD